MKKIIIFIMLIVLLPILSSCDTSFGGISKQIQDGTLFLSKEEKLERVFNRLSETSFTMEGSVSTDVKLITSGGINSQTIVIDMLVEANPNESYSEATLDGNTTMAYTRINETYVDLFTKTTGSWVHDVQTLENYQGDSNTFFLDIEVENLFTYKGGVWMGNTEVLSEALKQYSYPIIEGFGEKQVVLDKFEIEKYNIKMNDGEISEIDVVVSIRAISVVLNRELKVTMSMPMKVSKVGQTQVTVPSGLNFNK